MDKERTQMKRLAAAVSLAAITALPALAENIEITPHAERPSLTPDNFSGSTIVDILFRAGQHNQMMGSHATFSPGARTTWHDHPAGQYLIVTSGVGWIQERGGEKREIKAGDIVWIEPEVEHWHGASATVSMSHIALFDFVDGSGGVSMEPVSEEDYLSELAAD
jgi:quercetin dioxygenase-like cupin family protein